MCAGRPAGAVSDGRLPVASAPPQGHSSAPPVTEAAAATAEAHHSTVRRLRLPRAGAFR